MNDRFPGYDVLAKRQSPSWNEQTRRVIDARLAMPRTPRFLAPEEFGTLEAICARMLLQPADRPPVPIAAMVDAKLYDNAGDGFRDHRLPPLREAWRQGLAGIEAEARRRHNVGFTQLDGAEQDALLRLVQEGNVASDWHGMPAAVFFAKRLLFDVVSQYYAHPTAWNEIGFGGPASPRGYVRMDFDRRDPWEAAAAPPLGEAEARKANANIV